MAVTVRQLNRALLARQMLLQRERIGVADAVGRIMAVQAQEPASVYLGLWNRVAGFDPADLDAAYAARALVRSISIRLTLHTVRAEDYPSFHEAMVRNLRAARLADRRFLSTGLTAADVDAVVADLADHLADPRLAPEIEAWLAARFGRPIERAWWALKTYGPFVHHADGGPWSFRSGRSFRAAPDGPPRPEATEALGHLLRAYLRSFGPATAQDFGQFAMQRKPAWEAAIGHLGDELVRLDGPGGTALLDLAGSTVPDGDEPAPARLLPMFDNVLLAHVDRGRILPDAHRAHVIRRNGDTLPTVLVDGHVAGVWRPARDGRPGVEVSALVPFAARVWRAVDAEAAPLAALVAERDPTVYRRFDHWWDRLPAVERRIVGR